MHCPNCSEKKLKVIDIRNRELHANSLIRRRECTACGYRFNTKEVVVQKIQKPKIQKPKIQKPEEPELDIASILDSI